MRRSTKLLVVTILAVAASFALIRYGGPAGAAFGSLLASFTLIPAAGAVVYWLSED